MGVDKGSEAGIRLLVRNLPREPPKNHAQENNSDTPDVSLAGVVFFAAKNLWGKIGITADDSGGRSMCFPGVMEHGGSTEIDKFDNIR